MKILHFTTHLNIGGISSHVLTASRQMVRKGHEVCVASAGGGVCPEFHEAGVRTVDFPVHVKSELHPKLFLALPDIIYFIRKERFDVIHAHTRVAQVIAKLASLATGVPYMSTAHGFYKGRFGRKLVDAWGSRVIAVSDMVADDLQQTHGVDPSRIRIVPNAIDSAEFDRKLAERDSRAERSARGIPADALVVSSVSRLVKDKGHAFLIGAGARLADKHPSLVVVILGDGPERVALERLADKRLSGRCRVLRAERDVTGVLSMTDVFVHPATFREGFGLSIAEAMLAKKPVVATNIWAVNSIVASGENGLLVEPSSEEALAEGIGRYLDDPAFARKIALAGRELALRICSVDKMADALENVYREVVSPAEKRL